MNWKDLAPTDKEYIKTIYGTDISHEEKLDILTKRFKVTGRTIRRWCKVNLDLQKTKKLSSQLVAALDRELDSTLDVVFVTAAQNETAVNLYQLDNMLAYKEFLETEHKLKVGIVVIPMTYRNPSSIEKADAQNSEVWWADEVSEYIHYRKLVFGDVIISASSRIRPTTQEPLSGREGFASEGSLILGHPRIHFKTLPRFQDSPLKVMATTGAITYKHYSTSNAGEKGSLHHSYGMVVIEKKTDNTCFVPRNVKISSDGSFCDLTYEVKNGTVTTIASTKAMIFGDHHLRHLDTAKIRQSMNVLRAVNPDQIAIHDLLDGSTFNYHEKKDLFIRKKKIKEGNYLIDHEVDEALEYLINLSDNYPGIINIMHSNHDDFLDKFINDDDWKKDLHNSEAYLKFALIQQSVDLTQHGNIFGYLVNSIGNKNIKYVKGSDSLNIGGYQIVHAHIGANGSKGNPQLFKRLNTKLIGAHTHSPLILDGVNYVGCSCLLNQYYNSRGGMSSWAHADLIIHNNNKSQLLVYDDEYKVSKFI